MNLFRATAGAGLAAMCAAGVAMAQFAGGGSGDLMIDADTLDIHNSEGYAVYQGRVDAVRGDTQIRTDRLELYFAQGENTAGRGLDHVIAIGNVYYVTPTQIAHGQRAYYDLASETVTLTGNVTVTQECDVLTGEEVVINLTTNDAQVRAAPAASDGRPGRVRTVIHDSGANAAAQGCEQ